MNERIWTTSSIDTVVGPREHPAVPASGVSSTALAGRNPGCRRLPRSASPWFVGLEPIRTSLPSSRPARHHVVTVRKMSFRTLISEVIAADLAGSSVTTLGSAPSVLFGLCPI